MKTYKIVKIKNGYKNIGSTTELYGVILSEEKDSAVIMLFNTNDYGDYATLKVKKSDFEITDMLLPEKLAIELEKYIVENTEKVANKNAFKILPFNECDEVILLAEKERYLKYGLHKGDRGVVASAYAVQGKILVDFSAQSDNSDGIVSISIEDLRKVN